MASSLDISSMKNEEIAKKVRLSFFIKQFNLSKNPEKLKLTLFSPMTIPLLLFLHLQLEELARSNALLIIEGDMMERFIARRGNKGTLMHDGGSRAPNNLLPDQKIDLATEELEHSKTDVKNVALKGQTTIETLDVEFLNVVG